MDLKDNFGGDTNLFITGRDIKFLCECVEKICTRMAVILDTNIKVKSEDSRSRYHALSMTLTHNTEFGVYVCEAYNVKSAEKLKLNYLLCKNLSYDS